MLITIGALRVKGGLISSHHTGISPKHFVRKGKRAGKCFAGWGRTFYSTKLK